jgi:hypothetical protein
MVQAAALAQFGAGLASEIAQTVALNALQTVALEDMPASVVENRKMIINGPWPKSLDPY